METIRIIDGLLELIAYCKENDRQEMVEIINKCIEAFHALIALEKIEFFLERDLFGREVKNALELAGWRRTNERTLDE